jgi:glucose/arabinose dehydrogenase
VLKLLGIGAVAATLAACGAGEAPAGGADTGGSTERAESGTVSESAAGGSRTLRLVTVAKGFRDPVYVASTPSQPKRIYVVEQIGRIRVVQNGRVLATPFLDIQSLTDDGGERGLLSMAFHPRYATNRLFYVNYTDNNGDTRVVEYRARAGGSPQRVRELLFVEQPYANHNGGQLQFGPDGYLYVGMGDGGSRGDPENRAQNPASRLGKLLRADVGRASPDWEIVGLGLRNPWRFSFDRRTGALYMGDVGQGEWEEIDFTPRSSPGLENYGWDVYEGDHDFEDKRPGPGELVFPIHEYSHDEGCSVTGGYVYRGARIQSARGRYFFGDYCSGTVWSLRVRNGEATDVRRHAFRVDALTSFGEGAAGQLFLVGHGGTIYRLAQS